uniref:Uncharacterized protein n=1 Tax=Tetraselmis sp. GSL018 TaxID=582737 RepID=A0A061S9A9_9CHLO|mmetsp:Transcript_31997/g.76019  ORF Transcript_31997/g.76019 Transcript_31997/m.76019 type:complete len:329 (+) Transcript_31997:870-1856(+)|eukprot:CAMPEP_0177593718 /NCGR_PEP_ID=MMETSP0419_2-20121207/9333_1 /TAXON_ID=582737 /ORGANISM="Tetraselmis sp., Strain GSL018" /LENGTH=328 /DNA_ID=CAMNT_0019084851 /DNA_START=219 /DNA_END=1205 /DNA_ORIENTATION=-
MVSAPNDQPAYDTGGPSSSQPHRQLLSAVGEEQLQQLAKLPPEALLNLKEVVSQLVESHSRSQAFTRPELSHQNHLTDEWAAAPDGQATPWAGQAYLSSRHGQSSRAPSEAAQVDQHLWPTPPPAAQPSRQWDDAGWNRASATAKRHKPSHQGRPASSCQRQLLLGAREPARPWAEPVTEDEMMISPRSAQMLIASVMEGAGDGGAGSTQQPSHRLDGPNQSSCSVTTSGATGSHAQEQQATAVWQSAEPCEPAAPASPALRPFDGLLRDSRDLSVLAQLNASMEKAAQAQGKTFDAARRVMQPPPPPARAWFPASAGRGPAAVAASQ